MQDVVSAHLHPSTNSLRDQADLLLNELFCHLVLGQDNVVGPVEAQTQCVLRIEQAVRNTRHLVMYVSNSVQALECCRSLNGSPEQSVRVRTRSFLGQWLL